MSAQANDRPLWASGLCAGLAAAGIRHVIYVPDNPLAHVLRILESEASVRMVLATREEEAFGIAAGVYLGGGKPTVMLQSSGLGNSLNTLGSLLVAYQIPALIVLSLRGDLHEWNAAQVPMGRTVRVALDAMGIPHATIDAADRSQETVRVMAAQAFGTRMPAACLLARALTTPIPAQEMMR